MAKLILVVTSLFFLISIPVHNEQVKKPSIISVKDWGGKLPTGEKEKHSIEYITIHHSGEVFEESRDPASYMRGLQKFSQQDKDWIDIPYHFCIDLTGKIYEARPLDYPGDTNTEYNPTGHALINVMGNYEVQTIKPEQLEALAHLTAWLAEKYEVPTQKIATHKDHSENTVCPGKDLYKYFKDGSFISSVKKYLED